MADENKKTIAAKQFEVLKTHLARRIDAFKERKRINKRNANLVKALTIIFGFGITVFLGLNVDDWLKSIFSNIALVLGASVTMLGAWDAFSNYRSFWAQYTFTHAQLLALRADIEFEFPEGTDEISEVVLKKFYRRYQNILDESNEYWREVRKEESGKPL